MIRHEMTRFHICQVQSIAETREPAQSEMLL